MIDYSVDAIIVVDDSFKTVLWNAAAETMFGYSSQEVVDKPLIDLIVPDQYRKAMKKGLKIFGKTGNGPVIGKAAQLEAQRKDGSVFDIELSVSRVEKNGSYYAIGICRDISGRKKIERDVRESEERLRILFDYAPDAYYLTDLKGRLIDANKAAEAMIGLDKAGLVGKNLLDLNILPEDQIQKAAAILARNVEGTPTGPDELILKRRTGTKIYAEIRTYPVVIHDEDLVLGIARDVSSRKNAEEEILKEKNFFESIVNSLPGVFYILDDKLHILRWNKNLEKVTGYSEAEISNMGPFDFFDKEKLNDIAKWINRVFAKGQSSFETDLISRDGSKTPFFLSAMDVQIGDSHFLAGVGIDITERKEAEKKAEELTEILFDRTVELKRSEAKWLSIFETSKDALYISTIDGKITDLNPAGIALFGYSMDALTSLDTNDLYQSPDDRRTFGKEIQAKGYVQDFEIIYKRADGTLVECLETAVVRRDEAGNIVGYQGIIRDVSEKKKLQEELKEAKINAEQANQAKSQFLANMSHEIRTPMNGILGFSELLMEENLTEEQREYVKTIYESGQTLLTLINEILDLSKVESGAASVSGEEFFLFELLNGIVAITRLKARERGIELDLAIDPGYRAQGHHRSRQAQADTR